MAPQINLNRVLSWLQARKLEGSIIEGSRFHDLILSLDLPPAETVAGCIDAGWIVRCRVLPQTVKERLKVNPGPHKWFASHFARRQESVIGYRITDAVSAAFGHQQASDGNGKSMPLEALLDETTLAIKKIADGKTMTVDEKMKAILMLDRTWAGKGAPQWAKIMGCTDAAVRQTPTWKAIRKHRAD